MNIISWLGRFFRHCINMAAKADAGVRVDQFEAKFMTDGEISDFIHGRAIDWNEIRRRKQAGEVKWHRGPRDAAEVRA